MLQNCRCCRSTCPCQACCTACMPVACRLVCCIHAHAKQHRGIATPQQSGHCTNKIKCNSQAANRHTSPCRSLHQQNILQQPGGGQTHVPMHSFSLATHAQLLAGYSCTAFCWLRTRGIHNDVACAVAVALGADGRNHIRLVGGRAGGCPWVVLVDASVAGPATVPATGRDGCISTSFKGLLQLLVLQVEGVSMTVNLQMHCDCACTTQCQDLCAGRCSNALSAVPACLSPAAVQARRHCPV